MTQFPDLFAALSAPFAREEVRSFTVKNRQRMYIRARTAMNRLDTVLGPENWWDEFVPGEHSVLCRLTIRLPNGELLTKSDAGGYAGMPDSGDDDKSGYSDAFKRAAVKFGVGRYLYRDGVPSYYPGEVPTEPAPTPRQSVQDGSGRDPRPALAEHTIPEPEAAPAKSWDGSRLFKWAKEIDDRNGTSYLDALIRFGKGHKYPSRIVDWSDSQVKSAYRSVANDNRTARQG